MASSSSSSSRSRPPRTQLVPVAQSEAVSRRHYTAAVAGSGSLQPVPGSMQELQSQMALWQPFPGGGGGGGSQAEATWREFVREQERVERAMEAMQQQLDTPLARVTGTTDAAPLTNGAGGGGGGREVVRAGDGGATSREVMTWPAPVIRRHRNGLTSFSLDVDVGDTYRPDEIHVNIVDGHVLHVFARHRHQRRQVKDNGTLSASRKLCEFDRRFTLPDHQVRPENLRCLVSPEGILHIRGFLGQQVVQLQKAVSSDSSKAAKDGRAKRRKVNFAVFGSKKSR